MMAAASPSTEPPPPPKAKNRSSILGTLREAIRKVRFLLSSSTTRWMLLASVGARAPRRGISFGSPRPGLLEVDGSIVSPAPSSSSSRTSRSASLDTATTRSLSPPATSSVGASPRVLTRTSSVLSPASSSEGDEDIDRRADEFIAKFYRQLQMERQVSLQLRYVRGNSWDRTP